MKEFAKGAAKVIPYISRSADIKQDSLEDITVNKGMYERLKDIVEDQAEQIETLQSQVDDLQERYNNLHARHYAKYGDGDGMASSIREIIENTPLVKLSNTYNRKFFEDVPEDSIVKICNMLIEFVQSRGEQPSVFWLDMVKNGGIL